MPEFYLDFLKGERAGSALHFEQKVVKVGRSDEVELSFDEMGVSWEHAEFRYRDGDFWVIDQGSTNGTYVNEERAHNARLKDGDVVRFGKKGPVLKFRLQTDAAVVIPESSSEHPSYQQRHGKRKPRRRLPSELEIPVPPDLQAQPQSPGRLNPNARYSDLPPAAVVVGNSKLNSVLLLVPSVLFVGALVLLGVLYMDYQAQEVQLIQAQDATEQARKKLAEQQETARRDRVEAVAEEQRRADRLESELERTKRREEERLGRAAEKAERLQRELSDVRRRLTRVQGELEDERARLRAWSRQRPQPASGSGGVASWQDIERRLSPSVVFIATRCKGRNAKGETVDLSCFGTGFIASSQGHIVTNKHVIQPWKFRPLAERMVREGIEVIDSSYQVHVWRGGTRFLRKGKGRHARLDLSTGWSTQSDTLEVLRTAPDRWDTVMLGGDGPRAYRAHADGNEDVAILKARASGLAPLPLARSDSVNKLDEVMVLGYPAGPAILEDGVAETSPARGTVRKVEQTIQVSAAMLGGNSGGPLIDAKGRVIGIATRVVKGTETLGTCLRIEHARELLHGGSH